MHRFCSKPYPLRLPRKAPYTTPRFSFPLLKRKPQAWGGVTHPKDNKPRLNCRFSSPNRILSQSIWNILVSTKEVLLCSKEDYVIYLIRPSSLPPEGKVTLLQTILFFFSFVDNFLAPSPSTSYKNQPFLYKSSPLARWDAAWLKNLLIKPVRSSNLPCWILFFNTGNL